MTKHPMAMMSIKSERATMDESSKRLPSIPPRTEAVVIRKLLTADAAPLAPEKHCKALETEGPQIIAAPKKYKPTASIIRRGEVGKNKLIPTSNSPPAKLNMMPQARVLSVPSQFKIVDVRREPKT